MKLGFQLTYNVIEPDCLKKISFVDFSAITTQYVTKIRSADPDFFEYEYIILAGLIYLCPNVVIG